MCCKNCGGTMQGDGYKTVLACEFADESKLDGLEPDANPVYCDFDSTSE
jgi:hypothetical protein